MLGAAVAAAAAAVAALATRSLDSFPVHGCCENPGDLVVGTGPRIFLWSGNDELQFVAGSGADCVDSAVAQIRSDLPKPQGPRGPRGPQEPRGPTKKKWEAA